MALFKVEDTHKALEDLLHRERTAIIGGRFEELEALISEKERLLNAVTRSKISTDCLARLKEESERNGLLLQAMQAGVTSALDYLRTLKEPQKPLTTYDAAGRAHKIKSTQPETNRRA